MIDGLWLPTAAEIGGESYPINADFRDILEVIDWLNNPDVDEPTRFYVALSLFYERFEDMPKSSYKEAAQWMADFISAGERDDGRPRPKLMDWEQDFKYIVAPVNRVLGAEIRSLEYLHWWTFISAYYEIGGECTFAQIIRIRNLRAKGKKLDKADQEWYRDNRELVDFKTTYTQAEQDILSQFCAEQ